MRRLLFGFAVLLLAMACGSPPTATPTGPASAAREVTPGSDSEEMAPDGVNGQRCGVERWNVKTGTDADAGKVNLANVQDTTVAQLVALDGGRPQPDSVLKAHASSRIAPAELTVYRVHATLTLFKQEADSDVHLVLSDGSKTMIAEIPLPQCIGPGSPFAPMVEQARRDFTARYALPLAPGGSGLTRVRQPVTVTGCGFWDFPHGQTGLAQNAVELHPVLRVQLG